MSEIESVDPVDLPEDKIAKLDPPKKDKIPPWMPSTIPESFLDDKGDVALTTQTDSVSITHSNSKNLYNHYLEAVQKLIYEGIAPTDAFKKIGLPNIPAVRKALMTKILIDTAQQGDFPAELKAAVLKGEAFRMFVDAAARGDDQQARAWAHTLMKDPQLGMNKKEVTITVKDDALNTLLAEDVEVVE